MLRLPGLGEAGVVAGQKGSLAQQGAEVARLTREAYSSNGAFIRKFTVDGRL
jgi:hypothetical protein